MKLYRYSNSPLLSGNLVEIHEDMLWLYKTQVMLHEFDVIKTTQCGSWIADTYGRNGKKFVNHNCRKQYAYKTIEEAKVSFIARKKMQISILEARLDAAKVSICLLDVESRKAYNYFTFDKLK